MEIKRKQSLRQLNTFGIDVYAKFYVEFTSVEILHSILSDPEYIKEERLILGGGSNILFTKDFNGIVLKNTIKGLEVIREDDHYSYVKAGAGEIWHDLVLYAISKNLGGIENLSLIPGTTGASPIQNIGAYGVELKDVFDRLEAYEIETGKLREFTAQECQFGYRDSIFKREAKGKYIITSVTLRLNKVPVLNTSYGAIQDTLKEMGITELSVKAVSDAIINIRRSKLPDPAVIGNAGSFFKNPEIPETQFEKLKLQYPAIPCFKTVPGKVKVPAGWLNEQCGWKGKVVGATGVHKMQALVLVNYGNALGSDVKKLAEDIRSSVKKKFGIELEIEVNIV